MTHKSTLILTMIAVTGTAASADIFNWAGGSGDWDNDNLWFGPAGQYPNSIVDSATVSGNSVEVLLAANTVTGTLNILNGAGVYSHGFSMFVNGDTQINGGSSTLVVNETAALNDFDTDSLLIRNGAFLILNDGLAQFDDSVSIELGSAILGVGTIEMNSTTGDLDIVHGAIWADIGGANGDTILISRTQSSTSRLDLTSPDSALIAWPGTTIDIQIPYRGSVGGSLSISSDSTILSENAIVGSQNSDVSLFGGVVAGPDHAVLDAPVIDLYGSMTINRQSVLRAPFIALRGTGEMGSDSELNIDATSIIFDSLSVSPINDDGALIRFGVNSTTLNVNGGTTTIDTGVGGQFDLDGFGAMTVNIASGSSLVLDVEFIERFGSNDFDSVLNIDGTLDVMQTVPMVRWTNSTGTINLDGGTIHGRILENESLIQGSGSITPVVLNYGTIIADGSTLAFDHLNLGGFDLATRGVIRAELGDLSSSHNSGGYQFFGGDMYVGDGAGIREVLETNGGIIFGALEGVPSQLSMNSGRLRGLGLILGADFSTQGTSQLRASGANSADWVRFVDTGVNTISGALEIDGHSRVDAGAQFSGDGSIVAVHTAKTMNMTSGADLQNVGLVNHGAISFGDFFEGVGQASVASLTLASTSKLRIDLAGDNNGIEHDQLQVLGSASVSGTLEVGLIDGFSVSLGDVFTILTAQTVSGSFTNIDYTGLELGQSAVAVMYEDHIDVLVTCRADLNADGDLDFFDISTFLTAFGVQDPIADFTNDGQFDFFDIAGFLSAFESGCP